MGGGGGVDQNDAQLVHYSPVRKSQKWTTKVFLHFLDEAVFNSHVVYKKSGGTKSFLEFKLLIIDNLLRRAEVDIEGKHTRKGNHYPELIPAKEKKEKPQKRCCLCYKEGIRKETRYQCDTCRKHTALCPAPCFRIYHEN